MGTHPIFESDFDCLTDPKMSAWGSWGTSAWGEGISRSQSSTAGRIFLSATRKRQPKQEEDLRTEFKDLMKMMKLFELTEKEEKDGKKKMESTDEKYESAISAYREKIVARERSQLNLASSLGNAATYIAQDEDNKNYEILKNIIVEHDKVVEEEKMAKKKMEESKKALDEATAEYLKTRKNAINFKMTYLRRLLMLQRIWFQ